MTDNQRRALRLLLLVPAALLIASPALARRRPAARPARSTRRCRPSPATGARCRSRCKLLLLMSLLTVLPSLLLMMTSFTRIIIVLSILRQALGLQQTPPNQVLVGPFALPVPVRDARR